MADLISLQISINEYVVLPTSVENLGTRNSGSPGLTDPANFNEQGVRMRKLNLKNAKNAIKVFIKTCLLK